MHFGSSLFLFLNLIPKTSLSNYKLSLTKHDFKIGKLRKELIFIIFETQVLPRIKLNKKL